MGIEASGTIHTIFETKQVSERFSKREFVIEMNDNPKYPQVVLFQLTGDRCVQLDGLNVGDSVSIEFSLRGREWKSPSGELKYFNSLDAWSVERKGERRTERKSESKSESGYGNSAPPAGGADDDIPF